MYADVRVLRGFLFPGLLAVKCQAKKREGDSTLVCRPSDLPLYQERSVIRMESQNAAKNSLEPSKIESVISSARTEVSNLVQNIGSYGETVAETFDYFENEIKSITNYLQEEQNLAPRAGAIVIGGLAGLILGLRGGPIRRVTFATLGALSLAAVCFPNEAALYSQTVLSDTKKLTKIAYNFMLGVKREDLETVDVPKIPTSLSEVWSIATDLGRSAQTLLLGDNEKTTENENRKESK